LTIPELRPGGTEVYAFALSSEPTAMTYSIKPVSNTSPPTGPSSPLSGIVALPLGGGVVSSGGTPPQPVYDTKHNLHRTGLTPNTTYDLDVAATTQAGLHLTAHARFTTLKQRVRMTLEKIVVSDDGDTFGSGEPTWFWQVGWPGGTVKDCYPQAAGHCQVGSASEGTIYPYANGSSKFSVVFAEENFRPVPNPNPQPGEEDFTSMPQQFLLSVSARESDSFLGSLDALFDWGAWLSGVSEATWQAPQGVEHARQSVTVAAEDGNFRSVMSFTFEVFYDAQSYPPNDGRVYSTSK
jgi:hypothetical protein